MTFTVDQSLAPWPSTDKYPVVIGPGLSLQYISAIFRTSLNGYRQQYVDLLDELLEKDTHAFSCISKRVTSLCTGVVQITSAEKGTPLCDDIAKVVSLQLKCIPDLMSHVSWLSWATYYAMSGCETHWARDGQTWFPERLSTVHSRRLSFPVPGSWDLYLWDQGNIIPNFGVGRTNGSPYGLRIADVPGKFLIHSPQIRGNYPTREGLGRQLAYWMALKLAATRNAPAYLERFARPIPEASYSTTGPDGNPRKASDPDIDDARNALQAWGAGRLTSWLHADSIKLGDGKFDSGTAKITFSEWIAICNAEMSKATLGGTLSTEVGSSGGNRALGEEQGKGEGRLTKFDAALLAETIRRDLVVWIVKKNFPKAKLSDVPHVKVHVEGDPDPSTILERASKAVALGGVVDHDATMEQAGIAVIQAGDTTRRRLIAVKAIDSLDKYDPDLVARATENAGAVAALQKLTTPPALAPTNDAVPGGEDPPVEGDQPNPDGPAEPES